MISCQNSTWLQTELWRDVFCSVCHIFYYTFQAMEESGLLQRNNSLHKFVLHYIFTPRINKALQSFAASWNHHPMRTERHWSPFQMWTLKWVARHEESFTSRHFWYSRIRRRCWRPTMVWVWPFCSNTKWWWTFHRRSWRCQYRLTYRHLDFA